MGLRWVRPLASSQGDGIDLAGISAGAFRLEAGTFRGCCRPQQACFLGLPAEGQCPGQIGCDVERLLREALESPELSGGFREIWLKA